MINQLATIIQQAQNSQSTSISDKAIEDDYLSDASVPVQQTNPPSSGVTATCTLVQPVTCSALMTGLPSLTPLPPQPVLPPTLARIQEKIAKGEYNHFTTLLPKSMFSTPEPQPQSLTFQLNSSGDNYSIQPQASSKKITSFSAWM